MPLPTTSIVPVDLHNPGQFLACCGLFELIARVDPEAEAWFGDGEFRMSANIGLRDLFERIRRVTVDNTMTPAEWARLQELSALGREDRASAEGLNDEKKALESLRRESAIVLEGEFSLRIDWFRDDVAGGSRFKTWAGQQSVLEIARAMHGGLCRTTAVDPPSPWVNARQAELPFYFDSNLGAWGAALDVGFSFDPLSETNVTRIAVTCRPALEFLAFVGLQRFRPGPAGKNRFVYVPWPWPLPVSVAPAVASMAFACRDARAYEFRLLYRTKYLKSFLPGFPFEGDAHE